MYDIKRLKAEIKDAARRCVQAKHARREAERALCATTSTNWNDRIALWKSLNTARAEFCGASDQMTILCSIRAHMRGRLHAMFERQRDGSAKARTLADQAAQVGHYLKDYEIGTAAA